MLKPEPWPSDERARAGSISGIADRCEGMTLPVQVESVAFFDGSGSWMCLAPRASRRTGVSIPESDETA